MNRTNRRQMRANERVRPNKGPVLFSRAADDELQKKSKEMAEGLSTATIARGNASAANLLVTLAVNALYEDTTAIERRSVRLIEQWEKEPQVVLLDTNPQIAAEPPKLQLTDGSEGGGAVADGDKAEDEDREAAPEETADAGGTSSGPAEPKALTPESRKAKGPKPDGKVPGSPTQNDREPEILEGEYEMVSEPGGVRAPEAVHR